MLVVEEWDFKIFSTHKVRLYFDLKEIVQTDSHSRLDIMCYRTKQNAKLIEIGKTFNADFIEPETYTPMPAIHAFNFLKTPVITDENQTEIEFFNGDWSPSGRKATRLKKWPWMLGLKPPQNNRPSGIR